MVILLSAVDIIVGLVFKYTADTTSGMKINNSNGTAIDDHSANN